MARYGRSAEESFFRERELNMRRPTGQLLEERFLHEIVSWIRNTNEARKTKDVPGIRLYSHHPGDANDLFRGTDLKLVDFSGIIGKYTGHLRLDITHDFSGKDNMPLIAAQKNPIMLGGGKYPLSIGIRVGNNTKAFDDPVIVMGMDATPRQVKEIEDGSFYAGLRDNMQKILMTAGDAMQEYTRLTDPDYRSFLERKKDEIPEPGVTLKAVKRGRSEVLNHRAKWYTPFASTAKDLVSATLGTELVPIGGDAPKYGYIARLNQKVAAADARDKNEEEKHRNSDIRYT